MKNTVSSKDFVSGIITVRMDSKDETILPRRYVKAYQKLSKIKNIKITTTDKGVGVILFDFYIYIEKIELHFGHPDTYQKI